jgi:competence protein ComEC
MELLFSLPKRLLVWLRGRLMKLCMPLFLVSMASILGILAAERLPGVPTSLWLGLACSCLGYAWWKKQLWAVLLATFGVFGYQYRVADTDHLRSFLETQPQQMQSLHFTGMVDTSVEEDPGSPNGWKFGLKVDTINDQPWPYTSVLVKLRTLTPPAYGDMVSATGVAFLETAPRNPGEFDYAFYLRHESYAAEVRIAGVEGLAITQHGHGNSLYATALRSREWLGNTVTRGLERDPTLAATIRAMVLGTQESTPTEVEEAFIYSGTMHVFAVSGMHVVLFAWVLWQFLKPLMMPRGWLLAIVIPLMFFFVFITGLRASAWRAAIMAALMLSGPLLNRRSDLFNSLGCAALLLLAWDPHQLFNAGFQLSFGVLFALAMLTQLFLEPLSAYHQPDPFIPWQLITSEQRLVLFLKKKVLECLAVSLASTVGCAPLMIGHFGLLTPIGVVANLFLVFLSSAILFTACVSILVAALHLPYLSLLANHANYALAVLSVGLAGFFAKVPGGHFFVNMQPWKPGETARLTVLDIPGGGASHAWIEPTSSWLIDCGGPRSWSRTLRPFLLHRQITALDGLFLTHRDTDHTGAAGEVRKFFSPRRTLVGPRQTAKINTLKTDTIVYNGDFRTLSPQTRLQVIYPLEESAYGLADDRCPVFLIHHAGWKLLFMGDSGFLAEKWILENARWLRADIIIKGQCTNDLSGLPEFLNLVRPKAIICSDSLFPKEERLSPEWIAMVKTKGIPLFDQLQTGAVDVSLRGETLIVTGFLNRQQLELHQPKPQPQPTFWK